MNEKISERVFSWNITFNVLGLLKIVLLILILGQFRSKSFGACNFYPTQEMSFGQLSTKNNSGSLCLLHSGGEPLLFVKNLLKLHFLCEILSYMVQIIRI